MAASLSDVPDRYDVVFQLNDGTTYGFLLADSVESNLPFRTHKALYSYSPTFLERQNVSNQYGDNFQDFFLTGSQDDFSLGEQQKFFRVNDANRSRRYWTGSYIDPVTVPGNVTLTYSTSSASSAVSVVTPAAINQNGGYDWWGADNTNLYGISSTPALTSAGSHAAGTVRAITTDPSNVYIAGSSGVRKYNVASAAFSTFASTTSIYRLAYLNNILFGYDSSDSLVSFDASGNSTTQFQWKNADATEGLVNNIFFAPYGGSLFILRGANQQYELWKYDGSGVLMQAQLPPDFIATSMCVASGIVFIGGYTQEGSAERTSVKFFVNGSLGELWRSPVTNGGLTSVPVAPFGNGIVFVDPTSPGKAYQYDIALGGIHAIVGIAAQATGIWNSNINSTFLAATGSSVYAYKTGSYATIGFLETSQYDFDNTLLKIFRGVKVDADIPTNSAIDIWYQIDGCGGSYTLLQGSASSGTEYLLPASTTGHSISLKIVLNSSSPTVTPTLKRVYVRAAPTLQQFRRREFLFDLSGGVRDELGKSSMRCRDGTVYPLDPTTAAKALIKIATQTIPFTVQDRFDQYTALADLQQNEAGYDGFAVYDVRPNVLIARINLREV